MFLGTVELILGVVILSTHSVNGSCKDGQMYKPCTCTDENMRQVSLSCYHVSLKYIHEVFQRISLKKKTIDDLHIWGVNGSTKIRKDLFGNVPIMYITLQAPSLREIDKDVLKGQENTLKRFRISSSNLTTIPHTLIKNIKTLNSFSFDRSKLVEAIEEDAFKGFICAKSINFLSYSQNSIKTIHKGAFRHLSNLLTLHLSFNNLKTIDANIFSLKMTTLYFIDIAGNQLQTLNDAFLRRLPYGSLMICSYNKFTVLSKRFFRTIVSKDIRIKLGYNDLVCDCSVNMVATANVQGLGYLWGNRSKCEAPKNLKNKLLKKLTYTDLGDNCYVEPEDIDAVYNRSNEYLTFRANRDDKMYAEVMKILDWIDRKF